jgi:hypothetical protein
MIRTAHVTNAANKLIVTHYMETDGWPKYVDSLFKGDKIADLTPNQKTSLYYAVRKYGLGIETKFCFDKEKQTFTCYIS